MTLGEKLSMIQQEFKAKKSRYNSFGKYNFRSAEDILEGLKPFNSKYGVYVTVSEELILGSQVPTINSTAKIVDAKTGESILATAIVGVDLAQKGMQIPQSFGSASSYAKKYALGNLLLIDDTADSDATNGHNKTTAVTSAPSTATSSPGSDAFKQSIDYIKGAPSDKKETSYDMIMQKYGDKFSDKQKEALKKFV